MSEKSETGRRDKTAETNSAFLPVDTFDLVVFGGTGDLARRKLIPSLYHRFCDGQITSESRIIGTSRSQRSPEEYNKLVHDAYNSFSGDGDYKDNQWPKFEKQLDYVSIDVGSKTADWSGLAKALSKDKNRVRVFYLAVPPKLYVEICKGLKAAGLVTPNARVVLEKPIGTDFKTAKAVNEGVGAVFAENCIYRIDHYLGKETVQNLLVLRFANVLLEPLWSNRAIDHIEITVAESIGVGGRGAYYDGAGALRDMLQNHLLQLLCLTAMETPASLDADDVRTEKLKVLRALRPITAENAAHDTVRGQYAKGKVGEEVMTDYLTDVGADFSETESFVAIKAHIDNWRWAGVPIYIRTGKRMKSRRSDIVIQFKPVPHSVFGDSQLNPNRLVIRLQPDEAVRLWLEIKEPGAGGLRLQSVPLNLTYADNFTVRYPDAYERLLMDVVRGNLSLFMRGDEVEAAWKWVDNIIAAWQETGQRLELYQAGQDGPEESHDMLAKDGNTWV